MEKSPQARREVSTQTLANAATTVSTHGRHINPPFILNEDQPLHHSLEIILPLLLPEKAKTYKIWVSLTPPYFHHSAG